MKSNNDIGIDPLRISAVLFIITIIAFGFGLTGVNDIDYSNEGNTVLARSLVVSILGLTSGLGSAIFYVVHIFGSRFEKL